MKRLSLPALALALGFGGAAEAAGPQAPSSSIADDAEIAAPVRTGNLTVFPLRAKTPPEPVDYDTLDAALEAKTLTILEKGTEGQVSALHVNNTGKRPIYALSGEVLLGGKQDRIVAQNTIIPAGAKGFEIAVFCVEHGRWQKKTERFESAKKLAHTKLRQTALAKKSQSDVWSEVAETNKKRKTRNKTDTYRAAIADKERAAREASVAAAIEAHTARMSDVAGLVVVINGKPRAVEWFSDPSLYRRLEHKLISSYVAEALDADDGKTREAPKAAAIAKFMKDAEQASSKGTYASGEAETFDFESDQVDGQAVMAKPKPGKKARAVHKSFYAK